jgi:hypothetical protein
MSEEIRASDAERERTVTALRDHAAGWGSGLYCHRRALPSRRLV